MNRILEVARREYVETVKTRMFLIGVLMTPLLIGGLIYVAERTAQGTGGPRPSKTIALCDPSGQIGAEAKAQFDAHNVSHAQQQIHLELAAADVAATAIPQDRKEEVARGRLDAYVVVEGNATDASAKFVFYTGSMKATDMDFISTAESLLNRAVVAQRCRERKLSPQLLAELNRWVRVEQVDVGTGGREQRQGPGRQMAALMLPFGFMFLMFMGVFGTGQHILTSIIEEKSSRVIEVLLSALSPFELMAGKILGLAGIGLTVIGMWAGAAFCTARWKGLEVSFPPEMLAYFMVYFVLGFLLFSSLLAAIGSVCNTIKEAQSLLMPLSLMLMLPMMMWFNLAQNPDGTLARVLSFIPPLTPMVMILRLSASHHLPAIEIAASIAVLAASVPATMWAAAKVFRTGVLLYGKRPSLAEIFRWVCQR